MAWDDESKKSTRRRAASRRSHSHGRRRRRRRVVGAATCDCIAPSRLTGLRGSVPRRFISCRNAGPFLCLPFFLGHRESPPPSILFPLRFSRRGRREHVCFILLVEQPRIRRRAGFVLLYGGCRVLETLGIAMKDILLSQPCPRISPKSLFWMRSPSFPLLLCHGGCRSYSSTVSCKSFPSSD